MATEAQPATIPLLGRVRGLGVVPLLGFTLIAFLLFWVVVNFVKFPGDSTQVLLIGLTTGAIYALVALGYTLVYGILRSEEHTSELQSLTNLVCRLLLEKKKT